VERNKKQDIDKAKVEAIEAFIQENYSIIEFLSENGQSVKADSSAISCFFHDDELPSLFIDEEKQIWKCHSCGRGGGYIKMVEFYNNLILEKKMNYYETVEWLLKNHPDLSAEFGLSVIRNYVEEKVKNYDHAELKSLLFGENSRAWKEIKTTPTYETLAKGIRKASVDVKLEFLIGLQNGYTIAELVELIGNGSTFLKDSKERANPVELDDLLGGV
jgi:hypothetical protein